MINIKEYDKLHEIILENKHLKVTILTLGATIKSIKYLDQFIENIDDEEKCK